MTPQELEELVQQDNWRSLLVDLIVKNELDPWDVDVAKLSSAFMETLKGMRSFYVPANVVLALAILLKFKSMNLYAEEEEQEDLSDIYSQEGVDIEDIRIIRRKPKLPITIADIVQTVEEAIRKIEQKKNRPKQTVIGPAKISINPEEFHKEVEELYTKILSLSKVREVSLFSLSGNDAEELSRTLLALLFLSHQGRVELFQERVFEDIKVIPNGHKEDG